jgi:hypothetical protein
MNKMKINSRPLGLMLTVVIIAGVLLFAGANLSYAQSTYTAPDGRVHSIPAGYLQDSYGIFYNSSSNMFYNPLTGQYSTTAPAGPATTTASGAYEIPTGYTASQYGTYYNASTGMYYHPPTGFFSSTAPTGPVFAQTGTATTTPTSPTTPTTPGLPVTGAGGEATRDIAVLTLAGLAVIGGMAIILMSRKKVS